MIGCGLPVLHMIHSVINCKKDLSEKEQIFIVFMVKKILLKFHLKQMCQM